MRKLEVEGKLKAARLEQVTHKEHLLSIEAGRERAEFERVLRYNHMCPVLLDCTDTGF